MYFEIENVNSFDPDAEAAITLSGAMGQEESRNLSENIQWGIKRKFEEGLFSSYKHFMGYRCVESPEPAFNGSGDSLFLSLLFTHFLILLVKRGFT